MKSGTQFIRVADSQDLCVFVSGHGVSADPKIFWETPRLVHENRYETVMDTLEL